MVAYLISFKTEGQAEEKIAFFFFFDLHNAFSLQKNSNTSG